MKLEIKENHKREFMELTKQSYDGFQSILDYLKTFKKKQN